MKNLMSTTLLVILLIGVFQDNIFNSMVSYKPIKERAAYNISNTSSPLSVDKAIKHSLELTSAQLEFNMQNSNCIHYAKLFTQLCNELLPDGWVATHQAGYLYLLGYNVHNYINYPGFKDHDFVVIKNTTTGEQIAVDPSLYDYTGIKYLKLKS